MPGGNKYSCLLPMLLLFIFCLAGCSTGKGGGLAVGEHFPALDVMNMAGKQVSFAEQLAAQMRLVSIRTIGCRYCESDFKELEKIRQHFSAKELDVAVIGVACEKEMMEVFLKNKKISFQVFVDEGTEVMQQTNTVLLPVAYLIDSSGRIHYKVQGALGYREIEDVLPGLLSL